MAARQHPSTYAYDRTPSRLKPTPRMTCGKWKGKKPPHTGPYEPLMYRPTPPKRKQSACMSSLNKKQRKTDTGTEVGSDTPEGWSILAERTPRAGWHHSPDCITGLQSRRAASPRKQGTVPTKPADELSLPDFELDDLNNSLHSLYIYDID